MRFRKSIKIAKGVRVNIGKKGVSSVSLGGKGLTLNASGKGIRATASIPGSGLSRSEMIYKSGNAQNPQPTELQNSSSINVKGKRSVSFLLGVGIFLIPYIFAWFTLRKGHSVLSRVVSFGWLSWLIFSITQRP
ncbi:DUF4236 domain-containing protein [Microbulbifer sp. CNSA002]|uniref:DUF4236 domain-containing protein n=1 Tax=Microbulbifer sp. CNSA002 TaxID=3373604 RepID=UPI0039B41B6B